ncbi:MAG: Lrp/AsnC family transcriptional regulator [Nanoarchaeota archaeon]|nr:Lrp/AsnC family transcriptional regulator [Nanoarchaeota archaeon]MBU1322020.1 Lrp/AsnC family transcriptional regulator [Nanoarchaeota archaeon]MBU1598105.1 Lrp/AsnC family transcriptional regulator [Nanoarchaeota archaeon]MBU2441766.1 Lrp/AsnC family transcriptional regulator [Nanoarchaeota archaeon]
MAVISRKSQERIKLDLYDKKLIFYLSQNSREPVNSLAKKLKISPQRTNYKIERLKKEILEPAIFMNFTLLKIPQYMIYLKDYSKEHIEQLMQSKEIYFLMQCVGAYQWIINVVTDDIETFCLKYLPDVHFEIYPVIRSIPDDYNPFNLSITPDLLKTDKAIELNNIDYSLLAYLIQHPIEPATKISEATGFDRKTITERIKKYLKSNLIQKFRYGINIFKISRIAYILRLEVVPNKKKQLLAHIRANIYSGFVFESYNQYAMHYLPPSHNELIKFVENLKAFDPNLKIDVLQNTEFFKVQLVPDVVVDVLKGRISRS